MPEMVTLMAMLPDNCSVLNVQPFIACTTVGSSLMAYCCCFSPILNRTGVLRNLPSKTSCNAGSCRHGSYLPYSIRCLGPPGAYTSATNFAFVANVNFDVGSLPKQRSWRASLTHCSNQLIISRSRVVHLHEEDLLLERDRRRRRIAAGGRRVDAATKTASSTSHSTCCSRLNAASSSRSRVVFTRVLAAHSSSTASALERQTRRVRVVVALTLFRRPP